MNPYHQMYGRTRVHKKELIKGIQWNQMHSMNMNRNQIK